MAQQRFLFHVEGDEPMQRDLELVSRERAGTHRPSKDRTFAQARIDVMRELARRGWSLSELALKVPHATSASGAVRLWFKPQAVHFTQGRGSHERAHARALAYDAPDIRKVSAAEFADWIGNRVQ